ncbi:MAG: T9SS type A sorting domain-containing protein, partial [Candidatus Kapaibacterium sp.]
ELDVRDKDFERVIYPNPTTNSVTIKIDCNRPTVHFQIVNNSGHVIGEKEVQATDRSLTIDFSKYPAGAYYIYIQCGREARIERVVRRD